MLINNTGNAAVRMKAATIVSTLSKVRPYAILPSHYHTHTHALASRASIYVTDK